MKFFLSKLLFLEFFYTIYKKLEVDTKENECRNKTNKTSTQRV